MPFLHLGYKTIHYTDLQPASTHDHHHPSSLPGDHDKEISSSPSPTTPRATLLFLHSAGSTQNVFFGLAVSLCEKGFRCVLFDQTGGGRSPYTGIEQSVKSLAEDARAVLGELGVEGSVGVVGEGVGGLVAAHLAANHKSQVLALILFGPLRPTHATKKIFKHRIHDVEHHHHGMDAVANSLPFTTPAKDASPIVRAFGREMLLANGVKGYVSLCRVLVNAEKKEEPYEGVEVPVLVVAGEEDGVATVKMCRGIYGELGTEGRKKHFEVLEKVGGWGCLEALGEVEKLVRAFLGEVLGK